jgi:hypothetical protein
MRSRSKKVFTVILEFERTTAVSQVRAATVQEALALWNKELLQDGACGLTKPQRAALISSHDADDSPVAVTGVVNVWCASRSPKRRRSLAILHFIKTHGMRRLSS